MKAIGPTFYAEIKAAGLTGLPFSWGDDGKIEFHVDMLQSQRDAVLAVYAAHDPTKIIVAQPDNGAALEASRRDALRKQIDSQIGSLSEDQQAVLRNLLKLIDKE